MEVTRQLEFFVWHWYALWFIVSYRLFKITVATVLSFFFFAAMYLGHRPLELIEFVYPSIIRGFSYTYNLVELVRCSEPKRRHAKNKLVVLEHSTPINRHMEVTDIASIDFAFPRIKLHSPSPWSSPLYSLSTLHNNPTFTWPETTNIYFNIFIPTHKFQPLYLKCKSAEIIATEIWMQMFFLRKSECKCTVHIETHTISTRKEFDTFEKVNSVSPSYCQIPTPCSFSDTRSCKLWEILINCSKQPILEYNNRAPPPQCCL